MQTEKQLAVFRQVLDSAESIVELVNELDLPDADPVRLGAFHDHARLLVRTSVRLCWAYARLLGVKADVIDQRLLSRDFCKPESER